jgi:hypothetical protein
VYGAMVAHIDKKGWLDKINHFSFIDEPNYNEPTGFTAGVVRSQAVLEAVGKVVWNFSDVPSNIDLTSGGVGKHYHYDEPYSTNTTLMHEVVDGVAAQIEIVAAACR